MKYKQANTHDKSDTLGRWGKCAALNVIFKNVRVGLKWHEKAAS